MINNPVTFSIDYLADASKDIPNMVVQLSFLVMSGIIVMVFAFAKDLNQARKGEVRGLRSEVGSLKFEG